MRYHLSLGPFHPHWPGNLRVGLEIENGIVQATESTVLHPPPLRPADWAGLSWEEGLTGVERLCALSSGAHALAYCQALETMAGLEVPPRARYLRVLLAEIERIASHLRTAGDILHLAGQPARARELSELRAAVVQIHQQITGRRFFSGLLSPGGLRRDLTDLTAVSLLVRQVKGPLYRLSHRVIAGRWAVSPLIGAGLLTKEYAEEQGVGGPVARASESPRDLRRDQPYAAYGELDPQLITQGGGDVFARWMVLVLEVLESLRLIEAIAADLPGGPVHVSADGAMAAGEAQSRVESPAGPLTVRVQGDDSGRLTGLWRTPPSPVHLAVLPRVLLGQSLDLVGVIVASLGLCAPCLVR